MSFFAAALVGFAIHRLRDFTGFADFTGLAVALTAEALFLATAFFATVFLATTFFTGAVFFTTGDLPATFLGATFLGADFARAGATFLAEAGFGGFFLLVAVFFAAATM